MAWGRYALKLFNKHSVHGVRVYANPARLEPYAETRYCFLGVTPKRKDKSDFLNLEIRQADESLYAVQDVHVKPELLSKNPSDPRAICPECREAYPAGQGPICRGCRLEMSYIVKEENP